MNKLTRFSSLTLLALMLLAFAPATSSWKVGNDYTVSFSTSGVSGVFKTFSGSIDFDASKLNQAKFDFKLDVTSINTGNGMQNTHAKGADWFDASKYPNIKFVSSSFEKTSSGYTVKGKLTIKNVTQEESIPFTFSQKGNKGKFVAKFSVNRVEYGVGKAGNDVGNSIKIEATIPVTKK